MSSNKKIIGGLVIFTFLIISFLIFRGVKKGAVSDAEFIFDTAEETDVISSFLENITEAAVGIKNPDSVQESKKESASNPSSKTENKSSPSSETKSKLPTKKNASSQKSSLPKSSSHKGKTKQKADKNTVKSNQKKTKENKERAKKEKNTPVPSTAIYPKEEKDLQTAATCELLISCAAIQKNIEQIRDEKRSLIPSDGILLNLADVPFEPGETVYDVVFRVCKEKGIPIDIDGTWTGYVKGIGNIYEKDCGPESGWIYCVNKRFLNTGVKGYKISQGDRIEILYTCQKGDYLNG